MPHGYSRGGAALGSNRGSMARSAVGHRRPGRSRVTRTYEAATRGPHLHGDNDGLTWFDTIGLIVEIGFGSSVDGAPMWVDVTDRVRSFSSSDGRRDETAGFSPGSATVVLSNADRRFDPTYTAGPYYGLIQPRTPIRVRYSESGERIHLFTGWVKGWPQDPVIPSDNTVALPCVDAFGILQRAQVRDGAYGAAVVAANPICYYPDQDPADTVVEDRMRRFDLVATSRVGVAAGYPLDASSAQTYTNGAALESSATLTTSARTVEACVVRGVAAVFGYARSTTDYLRFTVEANGYASWAFSSPAMNRSVNSNGSFPLLEVGREVIHVVASVESTGIAIYSDGVLRWGQDLVVGTASSGPALGITYSSGSSCAHVAFYADRTNAAEVLARYLAGVHGWGHPAGERSGARFHRILDAVGWPDTYRSVDTGDGAAARKSGEFTESDGSVSAAGDTVHEVFEAAGSALGALQDVEAAEQGMLFVTAAGLVALRTRQWIYGNGGTSIDLTVDGSTTPAAAYRPDLADDYMVNRVTVAWSDGSAVVEDTVLSSLWGQLDESVSAPTLGNGWLARQLGRAAIRVRGEPAARLRSVRFFMRNLSSGWRRQIAALVIGDTLVLYYTPQGVGNQATATFRVQGRSHQIDAYGNWTLELFGAPITPSFADAPYLVMGNATYGVIGAAAGNLVPF